MSRLILKYVDIFDAAAKLSGVASSLGSVTFECPCIATTDRCLSGERGDPLGHVECR
jgi:hypothetical protein